MHPATSRELHLAGDSGSYTAGLSTDLPMGPCPPPMLPISAKALRRRRLWTRILHVFLPDSCPASPSVRGGGAVSVCISPESTRHQPPWPKIISKWLSHTAPGGLLESRQLLPAPSCLPAPQGRAQGPLEPAGMLGGGCNALGYFSAKGRRGQPRRGSRSQPCLTRHRCEGRSGGKKIKNNLLP